MNSYNSRKAIGSVNSAASHINKLWKSRKEHRNDFALSKNDIATMNLDEYQAKTPLIDIKDLRIDNHTASVANLTELRDYIWFDRTHTPLTRLTIAKVLFTQEKTNLIVEVLTSQNCRINELYLDSCRARSDRMAQIFAALLHNKSIVNLKMRNMFIPLASLDQLVQVLQQNQYLNILTMRHTGLTDNAMKKLAQGLRGNTKLIYLDFRENTYECEGLQALLNSLMNNESLHTLRLNSLQILEESARSFVELLRHPSCRIKHLQMQELEVAQSDGACAVIDAIADLPVLETFDFSNNVITNELAQSIVKMVDKQTMLEVFSLDHCEMSTKIFRHIFQNIDNRELTFLNISWNQLSGDTIDEVVRVLKNNKNMKKLSMQHNRFGEVDLTNFANALKDHPSLEDLDITANDISSSQFNILFPAVQYSKVKKLHCRKNHIGGAKINSSLRGSVKMEVLDLSANRLTEENAYCLLEQVRGNVNFVTVRLDRNMMVSASLMNEIKEECKQNLLIQKKIMRYLPFKNEKNIKSLLASNLSSGTHSYSDYDCSQLVLKDQQLQNFDFILKFIRFNYSNCQKLALINLDMSRVQGQIIRGLDAKDNQLGKLKILHIENTELSEKALRCVIKSVKKMTDLTELHLVSLAVLEKYMSELAGAVKPLKLLKVLNLKQTTLRTRDVGQLVPLLVGNVAIETLDISKAIISKQNMIHLWLALHKNISVCTVNYSRLNFFALMEMKAIDAELTLNEIIKKRIIPHFEAARSWFSAKKKKKKMRELSLSRFPMEPSVSPAILKYIKMQKQMTELDLSGTSLTRIDINEFITEIVKGEVKLTKLNLSENSAVNDIVVEDLCLLFSQHSTMKELYLSKTSLTELGLLKLLDSIADSLKVKTLAVADCDITLTGISGRDIIESLKKNISLTTLLYDGNAFDMPFKKGIEKELELNQQIVEKILPQLINQEVNARKIKKGKFDQDNDNNDQDETVKSKNLGGKKQKRFDKLASIEEFDDQATQPKRHPTLIAEDVENIDGQSNDEQQNAIVLLSQPSRDRAGSDLATSEHNTERPLSLIPPEIHGRKRLRSALSSSEDIESLSSADEPWGGEQSSKSSLGSNCSNAGSPANFKEMKQTCGFNLSMKNINIENGIDFITKFTRVFQKINTIDFGDNKIQSKDAVQLSEELKLNKYIQNVVMKKKTMGSQHSKMLLKEIQKNKAIFDLSRSQKFNKESQSLDLARHKLSDLSFLPKMISDFTKLERLDLSNSDLRSKESVRQLCHMIDQNDTIKALKIRNCKINASTLNILAGALTKSCNENLSDLDIRDNPIQDQQYKVLFGLLQNNKSLLELKYTLYDAENIKVLNEFRQMFDQEISSSRIAAVFSTGHGGHSHGVPCWQKVCFPIWLWKSLIHDKHEAFRFKYDTEAISRIEQNLMPRIKRHLYYWSIVYYIILLALPYMALQDDCGKTYDSWLYIVYSLYIVCSGIWEIYQVLQIQRLAANKSLLSFNSWHVVELFMGTIARTDTFLDILFLHLIMNCWESFVPWVISSSIFATLNIIFPIFMLLRLIKTNFGNSLVLPYMESACFVAFIRETMLLATVLDSFCIDNSFYFAGRPLVFGKLMGFFSFFTQDLPQLTIHVLFKLVILSDAQKKLKTQTLLMVGMACSCLAILISIFNMVMCAQNEFDPIILEKELIRRREEEQFKEKRLAEINEAPSTKNRRESFKQNFSETAVFQKENLAFKVPSGGRQLKKAGSINPQGQFLNAELAEERKQSAMQRQETIVGRLKKKFEEEENQRDGVGKQMDAYMKYHDKALQSSKVTPAKTDRQTRLNSDLKQEDDQGFSDEDNQQSHRSLMKNYSKLTESMKQAAENKNVMKSFETETNDLISNRQQSEYKSRTKVTQVAPLSTTPPIMTHHQEMFTSIELKAALKDSSSGEDRKKLSEMQNAQSAASDKSVEEYIDEVRQIMQSESSVTSKSGTPQIDKRSKFLPQIDFRNQLDPQSDGLTLPSAKQSGLVLEQKDELGSKIVEEIMVSCESNDAKPFE